MGQEIIFITGAIAIWLTQQSNKQWQKYARIIGLIGQPFWIWSTYQSEQWGMLALSVFYTYTWMLGINNHWLKLKDRFKCFDGHDWTCAAEQGIKATEEQINTGVDGFTDYAKMYCRRCDHVYKPRNS